MSGWLASSLEYNSGMCGWSVVILGKKEKKNEIDNKVKKKREKWNKNCLFKFEIYLKYIKKKWICEWKSISNLWEIELNKFECAINQICLAAT